jgi:Restriction endonuclease
VSERLVRSFVEKARGRTVLAVILVLYLGIGLAVPISLHWRTLGLVEANLTGTMLAVVILITWSEVQESAANRRRLLDWTSDIRLLDAREFEWLVGELFRREGFEVRETGGMDTPDGNIDLELYLDGGRRIIQCKCWTAHSVGVDEIRKFLGTLMREHLAASDGIFVTLSTFTPQASAEAAEAGVSLLDGRDLHHRIETVRRSEACPICQEPMKLARSSYGWWLRCNAPGCTGKRDLGAEPGRAVDLLLQRS